MVSFRQFLLESAAQRKYLKGTGATKFDFPDTEIVHHDPENKLTVYHSLSPHSLYTLGARTYHCTNTRRNSWAHAYLNMGNVFTIHHNKRRYQMLLPKGRGIEEIKDEEGKEPKKFIQTHGDLLNKLRNIPHKTEHINFSQWKKPTDDELEKEIQ